MYLLFKKLTLLIKSISGCTSIIQSGFVSAKLFCSAIFISNSEPLISLFSKTSFSFVKSVKFSLDFSICVGELPVAAAIKSPISATLLTSVAHSPRLDNRSLETHVNSNLLSFSHYKIV